MTTQFEGQVVWITGGTSGLGREMALEFARRGAYVVPSGRRTQRLDEVCAEISSVSQASESFPPALGITLDVTDDQAVEDAPRAIIEQYGRLDVVVANAGFGVTGKFEDLSAEQWRHQLDVNVVGLASTVRCALPHLKATKGRIALISSVLGMVTAPKTGAYPASKYAVRAIGQMLSMELHGTGVSCTTIYPGFVKSEIGRVDNSGVYHPEKRDNRPSRLLWPTDKAARVMVNAIARRKRDYVFTVHGKVAGWLGRHCPALIHLALRSSSAKKDA
jgi:NAD(P)-dependent dehydrogenase (short-subunit alcohol dehydrogenase family)